MNWGDGCSNYIDDPYTGKQFYALVVDNCGAGDGFCGRNANAIQVS
jgi:sugar/nucleoside kinase (ribokinase family)